MIYDFTERKQQNECVVNRLSAYREKYNAPRMSRWQVKKLRDGMEREIKRQRRAGFVRRMSKVTATAAALAAAFLILPNTSASVAHAMEQIPLVGQWVQVVTFRDYQVETERNHADIQLAAVGIEGTQDDGAVQETLEKTTARISAEIQRITDELISEFEKNMADEMGYQDLIVKSEVLTRTEEYFTVKLLCYQGAGSGYQWNYYYTIDLRTGEQLKLQDLFSEGADYITPISDSIKNQMQEQMDADENVCYWLHDEIEALNFRSITDETSFYVNGDGNVVIGFNEGDVAPMYMGAVEFMIPDEVLGDIRK